MDALTRCPPISTPPTEDEIAQLFALNDALVRTVNDQNRVNQTLRQMLGLETDGLPPPPGVPSGPGYTGPNMLWGGPYPLFVGTTAPTQIKVWFNTTANQLLVWNWQTNSWVTVSPTVTVAATAPGGTLGQLYIDGEQKLWVKVDDWCELTFPVTNSGATIANGAVMTTSLTAPTTLVSGALWYQPVTNTLSMWNGSSWVVVGTTVIRTLRTPNYAVATWNAGGNRSQAMVAGGVMQLGGMRGINPATQQQQPGCGPGNTLGTVPPNTQPNGNLRINQIYSNIQVIMEAEGLSLFDIYNLDTYMTNAAYIGPTATLQAQPQFWGNGPYPCRTHIPILQLSGSDTEQEFPAVTGWPARMDIVEVTVWAYTGNFGKRNPTGLASEILAIPGVTKQVI